MEFEDVYCISLAGIDRIVEDGNEFRFNKTGNSLVRRLTITARERLVMHLVIQLFYKFEGLGAFRTL
jgi:hypothetical protein